MGTKKILSPKKFGSNKILIKKNFDKKKLRPAKNESKKFGQNWISNSLDITDMDKCWQYKCCLDRCQHESAQEGPRNLLLKFGQNRAINSRDMASFPISDEISWFKNFKQAGAELSQAQASQT